ncbi:hypothetical protein MUP37_02810, partial [Candidatus Bathyarchaeota archaeon]|nr:hypothetical protein [Candidatus Bathyarchaeota archaeon]
MKNPSNVRLRTLSLSYESLSIVGLIMLAVATFRSPSSTQDSDLLRRLSGLVFASICILGAVAGTFPKTCSRTSHFVNRENPSRKEENSHEARIVFTGHHPSCGQFNSHVLRFRDRTLCAGCAGLVLGAVISLVATASYLLFGLLAGGNMISFFWFGFTAVALGLLQYHIPYGDAGLVHLLLNTSFVLGDFLLLVGVNEIAGNPVLSAYFLVLTIYWILARITVSRLEHHIVCAA